MVDELLAAVAARLHDEGITPNKIGGCIIRYPYGEKSPITELVIRFGRRPDTTATQLDETAT